MKRLYIVFLFIFFTTLLFAQTPWVTLQNFIGTPRASAVMFIINDTVYAGTGRDTGTSGHISTNDFYKYNPTLNIWTPIASLPGDYRWLSSAFSIGNKGYIALGSGDTAGDLNEVWEYDPHANSWNQKTNFPGASRYGAFSFVINSKAYIGGGLPGNYNDLWEYNPTSDTWVSKSNFPASGRHSAISFSLNGKGYMGLGRDDTTLYNNDFWEYTPLTDSWVQKATFPDTGRYIGTGFSLNGKGYAGLGVVYGTLGNPYQDDFWEYNPTTDIWQNISNIPGVPRYHCVAASNDSIAYILGGLGEWNNLNDFYSLSFKNLSGISETSISNNVNVVSFNKIITIENQINKPIIFKTYDLLGNILASKIIETGKQEINFSSIANGIIIYQIIFKDGNIKCGKLAIVN